MTSFGQIFFNQFFQKILLQEICVHLRQSVDGKKFSNQLSNLVQEQDGTVLTYQEFAYDGNNNQTVVRDYLLPEGATDSSNASLYRTTETDSKIITQGIYCLKK